MTDMIDKELFDELMAMAVKTARDGNKECIRRLKKIGQGWRIDPANDHLQPAVVERIRGKQ